MARIVLFGAGSLQFGLGTVGDIFATEALAGSTVTLIDINKNALQLVHKRAQEFVEEHALSYTIESTTDREEGLQNADFVIISIEVGDRFRLWDQDRTIAQQYGIQQIYGENGGPGGLFHSLRIIPPILEICQDVMRICPTAYVFNYSNPMSKICTTVHKKFPELRFIGLCHEIASLERYLPPMMDMDYKDMDLLAGGLNHFSVLLQAKDKRTGKDIYPEIIESAASYFATVPSYTDYFMYFEEHGVMHNAEGARDIAPIQASREWGERRLFKFVLEKFGLLPITSDSHFGEYVSWAYDVADHKGILDFYRYYQNYLHNEAHAIELTRKERVSFLMEAIITGRPYVEEAVNIPNKGYIQELPEDIVVEVPARVDAKGVEGLPLGTLPVAYAALLQNQVGIHNMTAEALFSKSKKAVVQALLVDSVNTKAKHIEEFVEVMVETQKDFLAYLR